MNNSYLQIKEKISQIPIEAIAKETNFQKRKSKKVEAEEFVAAAFKSIQEGELTAASIAEEISYNEKKKVSRKAIDNKLSYRHEDFAKGIFGHILKKKLKVEESRKNSMFERFTGVFINDSSCLKMPENLYKLFPGPYSHKGECATARIQLRYNLLEDSYACMELMSYRDNDQKYSSEMVKQAQAGHLNIFDLGYVTLDSLEDLTTKGAYFVCRYLYGTNVYDVKEKKQIDLLKTLRDLYNQGIHHMDWNILLGAQKKLPVRLIAQRVPEEVYQKRLEKAKNDRHNDANHSQEYYQMLAWTLIITNVPKEIWDFKQVIRAYSFRWRIEMIFKCWKSSFQLQEIFKNKTWIRPPAAVMFLYLILAFLTLIFVPLYRYCQQQLWDKRQVWLSIFKFADFVKEHLSDLLFSAVLDDYLLDHLAYFCSYQKRKDRKNYLEILNMF